MKRYIISTLTMLFCLFPTMAWANNADGIMVYTVKRGDNLSRIASSYHQPVELLAIVNNVSEDKTIRPGERLLIPLEPAGEHIVLKKGDNPWTIARKHGVSTEMLLAVNDIADPTKLMPGNVLTLPTANNDEHFDVVEPVSKPVLVAKVSKERKVRRKISYRSEAKLIWPLQGPISSGYGTRWGNEFHHGIDIVADYGTPIQAAASGKVIEAGYKNRIYGNSVMIENETYTFLYSHCSSVLVDVGDYISAGDVIARVGDSGRSTGPHLHFEVRTPDGHINPLRLLP